MATLISAGAVAGLTTVVLTLMVGATRIIFAMSRDNLLPMSLAKVHPKHRTPLICLYLMLNLSLETWLRFLVWLAIGLVIYFVWSGRNSRLQTGKPLPHDLEQTLRENH